MRKKKILIYTYLVSIVFSLPVSAGNPFRVELGSKPKVSEYVSAEIRNSFVKESKLRCPGGTYYVRTGGGMLPSRRGNIVNLADVVCVKSGKIVSYKVVASTYDRVSEKGSSWVYEEGIVNPGGTEVRKSKGKIHLSKSISGQSGSISDYDICKKTIPPFPDPSKAVQ